MNEWNSFSLRKCIDVFYRLGGIISAYKIVPDEIDEIKVNISFCISLHMLTLTPGKRFFFFTVLQS